jgi:two-component system copper resistance phosphate regulon response regulator CusR
MSHHPLKALIVEDDHDTLITLCALLSPYYIVRTANTVQDALPILETTDIAIALLDIHLPDGNGIALCDSLRRRFPDMGIIMLSGEDITPTKLKSFSHGADDYMTKPYSPLELIARMQRLTRKMGQQEPGFLSYHDLTLNPATGEATRNEINIHLRPKEAAILSLLMRHSERTITTSTLIRSVWAGEADTGTLLATMKNLRAKIDKPFPQHYLHTVRGYGYVLTFKVPQLSNTSVSTAESYQ